MYIKDVLKGRNNNFDIIRFIAAVLVIFSHSFPLYLGTEKIEPLMFISKQSITFGGAAVAIFFIISGFLILMSYDKSNSTAIYLKKRILRIFPGLVVMLIFTIVFMGLFITELNLNNYFSDKYTYSYFFKNVTLIFNQWNLPGVFTNNIYPNAVNGSLWTLWYEFFFYILILLFGYFKLLKKNNITLYLCLSLFLNIIFHTIELLRIQDSIPMFNTLFMYIYLSSYFISGMYFYVNRATFKFTNKKSLIALIALIAFILLGIPKIGIAIFGSYLIFYVSFFSNKIFSSFTKYGDFSYGMYIYAFPIQQTTYFYLANSINFVTNFLLVFFISLIFSYFSWHLVEKKALMI